MAYLHLAEVPQSYSCQWCIPWPIDSGKRGKDHGNIRIGVLILVQGDSFSVRVLNELTDPSMPLATSVVSNDTSSFRASCSYAPLKALAWNFSEGFQLG